MQHFVLKVKMLNLQQTIMRPKIFLVPVVTFKSIKGHFCQAMEMSDFLVKNKLEQIVENFKVRQTFFIIIFLVKNAESESKDLRNSAAWHKKN